MPKLRRYHPGQAMITIVIFAVVLFGFVGLAIDGGMLYLERRQLQNAVDAACLAASSELGLGGTAVTAITKGQNFFATNLNEEAKAAYNLSFPVTGSTILPDRSAAPQGQNLTNGIEVAGKDVRVAATVPANTYFIRLLNISSYNVLARAHCGPTAGGGVSPIAVVRFPGYDQRGRRIGVADTSKTLPQAYSGGKNPKYVAVRDILQRDAINTGFINDGTSKNIVNASPWTDCSSTKRNWYDFATPLPAGYVIPPPSGVGPYHSPTAACVATQSQPGPVVEIVGQGATPNNGGSSFRGPVMLDLRNISASVTAYNNQSVAQNPNAWVDPILKYILTQYPGPDVNVGEQLAIYSGNKAGTIIDAFQKRYKAGDTVTTIIYDGTVQHKEDFGLTVQCLNSYKNPSPSDCVDTLAAYVERPAPARTTVSGVDYGPFATNSCKVASAAPYIYSKDYSNQYNGILGGSEELQPARYVINLTPQQLSADVTIQLSARPSGLNGSGATAGSPADFGGMKVRWWSGVWGTSNNQNTPYAGLTPLPNSNANLNWIDLNTAITVALPRNVPAGVSLTMEVIQTATGTQFACSNNQTAVEPGRKDGVQTIQIVGKVLNGAPIHSGYASLGMVNTNPSPFRANDYFLSFVEPFTLVSSGEATELNPAIKLIDANTGDALTQSQVGGVGTISNVVWYKDGVAQVAAPTGTYVKFNDCGTTCDPDLRIGIPSTLPIGLYYIDIQTPQRGCGDCVHSTRFILRVADLSANPSINDWVNVLCYADFLITDVSAPNTVLGRATSGCREPRDIIQGLTGRLSPW